LKRRREILLVKAEGKKPLARSTHKWENNIKTDPK
jgi:hypothetical protein